MLRPFLTRTGLADYLARLWRPDLEDALKPVRKDIRLLISRVEALQATLERTQHLAARGDRIAAQVKFVAVRDREQSQAVARAGGLLDAARGSTHVHTAIERSSLILEPFPHMVV